MTKPIEWVIPDTEAIVALFDYMEMKGHIKKPKPLENVIHLHCKLCGDTIHSKWSGDYVSCKCKSVGIDQTHHYSRFIGGKENYEIMNKQEEVK